MASETWFIDAQPRRTEIKSGKGVCFSFLKRKASSRSWSQVELINAIPNTRQTRYFLTSSVQLLSMYRVCTCVYARRWSAFVLVVLALLCS